MHICIAKLSLWGIKFRGLGAKCRVRAGCRGQSAGCRGQGTGGRGQDAGSRGQGVGCRVRSAGGRGGARRVVISNAVGVHL